MLAGRNNFSGWESSVLMNLASLSHDPHVWPHHFVVNLADDRYLEAHRPGPCAQVTSNNYTVSCWQASIQLATKRHFATAQLRCNRDAITLQSSSSS